MFKHDLTGLCCFFRFNYAYENVAFFKLLWRVNLFVLGSQTVGRLHVSFLKKRRTMTSLSEKISGGRPARHKS